MEGSMFFLLSLWQTTQSYSSVLFPLPFCPYLIFPFYPVKLILILEKIFYGSYEIQ